MTAPSIHWMSAFIDVPDDRFDAAATFWATATETSPSATRGDRGQFITLEPASGSASLRMQRHVGPARVHLDFHTEDIARVRDLALSLGAELDSEPGFAIMRSPGGLTFCLVNGSGDEQLGGPIQNPTPHRVDQLCIDIPHDRFEAETDFWNVLTGWGVGHTQLPEFRSLNQPDRIPFRLLFQRLGPADSRSHTDVHLDISCGEARSVIVERHLDIGATVIEAHGHWTILEDPAGLRYCLTDRRAFAPDSDAG